MNHLYYIISEPRSWEILEANYTAAVEAGVKYIQIRCKEATPIWINPLGALNKKLKENYDFKVILNDYPQWVNQYHFDGVHVGQEDMEVSKVRKLLGPDKIIGLTCNQPEHLNKKKQIQTADYIGWGPVYPTLTKRNSLLAHGVAESIQLLQKTQLENVFLIGGIKEADAHLLKKGFGLAVATGLETDGKFDIKKFKAFQ